MAAVTSCEYAPYSYLNKCCRLTRQDRKVVWVEEEGAARAEY